MNVNALLVDTLDSLLPTADGVYKGTATEYIVFNYTELPADFADDDAAHYRYLVQVHLYAPLEKNMPLFIGTRKRTARARAKRPEQC